MNLNSLEGGGEGLGGGTTVRRRLPDSRIGSVGNNHDS